MFPVAWGRRWEEQQIREIILAAAFRLQRSGCMFKEKKSLKDICKNWE